MTGFLGLLVATALGVDIGWQELPTGGVEYIVQLEPSALEALRAGEEVASDVPPNLRDVRRWRIRIGEGPLPRSARPRPHTAARQIIEPAAVPTVPSAQPVPLQREFPSPTPEGSYVEDSGPLLPAEYGTATEQPADWRPSDPWSEPAAAPVAHTETPTDKTSLSLHIPSYFGRVPDRPIARRFAHGASHRLDLAGEQSAPMPPRIVHRQSRPAPVAREEIEYSHQPAPAAVEHRPVRIAVNRTEDEVPEEPAAVETRTVTTRTPVRNNTAEERPWLPLLAALLLLFFSLGANLYLSWVTFEQRERYRTLLLRWRRLRDARPV